MGGLASFVFRTINKACFTFPGLAEVCDSDPDDPSEKILSLAAAMLVNDPTTATV